MLACNTSIPEQKTDRILFHPSPVDIELVGSILKVDNGIFVLIQDGPLKQPPCIVIPANDSAATIMKSTYQNKEDNAYQSTFKPFVKLTGNFLREDSLSPIFKYNWIVLLDENAEQQEIQQMEE